MAVTVAQLAVKVTADTAQAESNLQGVSAATDDAEKSAGGMNDAFAALAGTAAVAFITSQVSDLITAGETAQNTMTQTNAVLASTHDVSGLTAAGVQGIAESLAKVTPYSEDTNQSIENLLLTFTNISGKEMPAATEAVLNLATSMKEDGSSAALQLGKALGDPTKGYAQLQREGVTFTAAQIASIKSMQTAGDMAGAQGIILKELSTEFGNSARAAGTTFAGQMAIAGNAIEEDKEQIGERLIPILGDLMHAVAPILVGIGNLTHLVATNQTAFTIFAGIVGTLLAGAFTVAAVAAWSFVAPILAMAAPILGAVAAVAAVVVILKLAYDHFGFVRTAVQALMGAVTGQLLPALQGLWNVLEPVLLPVLKVIGAIIGGVVIGAFTLLAGILTHLVVPGLTLLITIITDVIRVIGTVASAVGNFASMIGGMVSKNISAMNDMRDKVGSAIGTMASNVGMVTHDMTSDVLNKMNSMSGGAVQRGIEMEEGVKSHVGSMVSGVTSAIGSFVGNVISKIESFASGFVGAIGGMVGRASSAMGSVAQGMLDVVTSLPGKMLAVAGNIIHALVQGITNGIGAVKNAVGGIVSAIGNFFPHSPVKEGPLMGLENWGGNVVGIIAGGIAGGKSAMQRASNTLVSGIGLGGASLGGIAAGSASGQAALAYSGSGAGQGQPIILQLDGRTLATVLMPYQVGAVRNRVGIRT